MILNFTNYLSKASLFEAYLMEAEKKAIEKQLLKNPQQIIQKTKKFNQFASEQRQGKFL